MTNVEIINLIGHALNAESLALLESNDSSAVNSWASDIEDARNEGTHFEVAGRFSKTGNPTLVRL